MKIPETGPYMFQHFESGGTTSIVTRRTCLPESTCGVCGESQWHSNLALPSLRLPASIGPRSLTLVRLSGRNRFLSLSREDFHGLAAEIRRGNPTIGQIMPGAWVGPITLKTRGKLTDVIWDATTPFFSRGLIAAIRQAGAMLHPEPVTVVHRGKPVRGYYYCRPALVELWDPKTLLRFYDRCAVCGGIRQRKGVSAVAANHGRVYRRVKWPGREGMVYSYEHMDHLFSDEFVNVATQGGFVGLSFERVGRWC